MIKAKIIKDSISKDGNRLTTFELEYNRYIHSEINTHRTFSRNAASSRAIPIDRMIELVETYPATPVEWGLNRSGMQADTTHSNPQVCVETWLRSAHRAIESARELQALGLHKQIVNRVLEPFQIMKTIVSSTDYDNFFYLRRHKDAQPEIQVLADLMYEEYTKSKPTLIKESEWHLPYVESRHVKGVLKYYDYSTGDELSLETAIKVSASCCAQVSYRKLDTSLDKAMKIHNMLVESKPIHASALEHQAHPFNLNSNMWGNFKGWAQYRHYINDESCFDYKKRIKDEGRDK